MNEKVVDEKEVFRNEFAALAIGAGIEPRFADAYYELVFEIATGLVSRGERLLVLGIAGAQGTGKSTLAKLLATVFERVFERRSVVMSLDDFYLTKAQRQQLAADVHPLFAVRGVPGTHDMALLQKVIATLKARGNCEVPTFNKAEDDRGEMISVMGRELDLLVIEGWCWNALPGSAAELEMPINRLEAEEDQNGVWRRHVNSELASPAYQSVFMEADVFFFLRAPDMESVRRWRYQQEQRLAERQPGKAIMSEQEIDRFIMYFERITKRMLKDMPKVANLTLYLDERHQVVRGPRNR